MQSLQECYCGGLRFALWHFLSFLVFSWCVLYFLNRPVSLACFHYSSLTEHGRLSWFILSFRCVASLSCQPLIFITHPCSSSPLWALFISWYWYWPLPCILTLIIASLTCSLSFSLGEGHRGQTYPLPVNSILGRKHFASNTRWPKTSQSSNV